MVSSKSRSKQADGAKSGSSRWWFGAFFFALTLGGTLGGLSYLASKGCESVGFRRQVTDLLSEKLKADVSIAPIRTNGLLFLSTSEIWMRAKDESWTVHLQNVSVELDPSSFFKNAWTFRSSQIANANVWIGNSLMLPDNPSAPLDQSQQWGDSRVVRLAYQLGLGLSDGPASIVASKIQAGKVSVRAGAADSKQTPSVEIAQSRLEANYAAGALKWKLLRGSARFSQHEPWTLVGLAGTVDAKGLMLGSGRATGLGNAAVDLRTVSHAEDGHLLVEVTASDLPVTQTIDRSAVNSLGRFSMGAEGQFISQAPNLHDFVFRGVGKFSGVRLGQLPLMQLVANQMDEPQFRNLVADNVTAQMEWRPGSLKLDQIAYSLPGLTSLSGQLAFEGSTVSGVLNLAMPPVLVGKFPGGKPADFSFPAAGMSRARVSIGGPEEAWTEDLTERLLAQVSSDMSLATIEFDGAKPGVRATSGARLLSAQPLSKDRAVQLETLFDKLLTTKDPLAP